MRKIIGAVAVALTLACLTPAPSVLASDGAGQISGRGWGAHRVGLGANYWWTLEDMDDHDVDSDGFSYLASYQYAPLRLLKFEAALEYFPELAGASMEMWAPEAFVTFGALVYAGAGVGMYYYNGDWSSDPFYMLRAGFDFPIAPRLFLDININYRFNDWETLEWADLQTDTLRLGAALRFTL